MPESSVWARRNLFQIRGKELLSRRATSNLAAAQDGPCRCHRGWRRRPDHFAGDPVVCPAASPTSTGHSCSTMPCCWATSRKRHMSPSWCRESVTGRTCAKTGSPRPRTCTEPHASTAVVLWKGYDNPADILAAAAGVDRVQRRPGHCCPRPHRIRRLPGSRVRAVVDRRGPQLRLDRHRGRAGRRRIRP